MTALCPRRDRCDRIQGVRVVVLGTFQIRDEAGLCVPLGGQRMATLLARLALTPGNTIATDALIHDLWGSEAPGGGAETLRRLASRARVRLSEYGLNCGPVPQRGGYRLDISTEVVDAVTFERLAAEGARLLRDGVPDRAREVLEEALSLWEGDAFGGIDADFAYRAAEQFNSQRLTTTEDHFDAMTQVADTNALIPELRAFCHQHPTRERSHSLLLQALHESGERGAALAVYEQLRQTLAEEFGADPSPQLQGMHAQILRDSGSAQPRGWTNPYLTQFFGRRKELQAIKTLLKRTRLVTLLGPGGIGKTRLSAEYADQAGPDRVCFVELSPLREGDSITGAVSAFLGRTDLLTAPSGLSRFDRLVASLSTVPTLLVLDNCEHLLDSAAQTVADLLAACPELSILTTSREPLGTMGEALVRVEPLLLSHSDGAVAMFENLASLARPGFRLDDRNEAAVADICRRLDGLPLAIELASTRVRSMTVQEIAEHLDERFRLLASVRRTGPDRHRTLSAVLDWTWNLLQTPERQLARRLAVLPGGATVDSAAAIAVTGELQKQDIPFLLASLTDKSLLRSTEFERHHIRYQLMEIPRAYLEEQLRRSSEEQQSQQAMLQYFLTLTEDAFDMLLGRDQAGALTILDAEQQNLTQCLRIAFGTGKVEVGRRLVTLLSWYWIIRGRYGEIERWFDVLEAHPGTLNSAAVSVSAGIRAVLPRHDETSAAPEGQSLTSGLNPDHLSHFPPLAVIAAKHHLGAGDHTRVASDAKVALTHPHPWVRAAGQALSALATEASGDVANAEDEVQAAVEAFQGVGDLWSSSQMAVVLAGLQSVRGDSAHAIESLQHALELERSLGLDESAVLVRIRLGQELLRAERADEAETVLRQALDTSGHVGPDLRMLVLIGLAELSLYQGRAQAGWQLYGQASGLLKKPVADRNYLRILLLHLEASLKLSEGHVDQARAAADQAWAAAQRSGDSALRAQTAELMAQALWHCEDLTDSARMLGAADGFRGRPDEGNPQVKLLKQNLTKALQQQNFEQAYAAGQRQPDPLLPARTYPPKK